MKNQQYMMPLFGVAVVFALIAFTAAIISVIFAITLNAIAVFLIIISRLEYKAAGIFFGGISFVFLGHFVGMSTFDYPKDELQELWNFTVSWIVVATPAIGAMLGFLVLDIANERQGFPTIKDDFDVWRKAQGFIKRSQTPNSVACPDSASEAFDVPPQKS